MLLLNQLLMAISSVAAVQVLYRINPFISIASLLLNFTNRGHDTLNVAMVAAGAYLCYNSNHISLTR